MNLFTYFTTCITLLLLGVGLAQAEVYIWTDVNGVKHFSATPPTGGNYSTLGESPEKPTQSATNKDGKQVISREKKHPAPAGKFTGVETFSHLTYSDQKSLKTIQKSLFPAVKEGNIIAINICRQTMHALGEADGLFRLPLRAGRDLPEEITDKWLEAVQKKGEAGDPFFKTVLGALYYNGHGVPQNDNTAFQLWQEAASLGYHGALCNIGDCYILGIGVTPDISKALDYYEQAGQRGSGPAWHHRGLIYLYGKEDIAPDLDKAVNSFKAAVAMNYSPSFLYLGSCYFKGKGVVKDRQYGLELLRKAFDLNDPNAVIVMRQHGILFSKGEIAAHQKSLSKLPGMNYDMPQTFPSVEIVTGGMGKVFRNIRRCDIHALKRELGDDPLKLYEGESNGWTPLTLAVASGCQDMTQFIVEELKDNVNQKHHVLGFTPLHIATLTGQKDLVKYLLDHGASLSASAPKHNDHYWYDSIYGTPLHTAAATGKYDILDLLIYRGGDYATSKSPTGRTVWDIATQAGGRDIITRILRRQNKSVPDYRMSVNEILTAVYKCNLGDKHSQKRQGEKVHRMIVRHPELHHEKGRHGGTLLHGLANHCQEKTLVFLLEQGLDANTCNNNGYTPLHRVHSNINKAKILLEYGAEINSIDSRGRTILHLQAKHPDNPETLAMIKFLLSRGAIKEIRDYSGRTPFEIAISQKESTKIAQALK